MKSEQIEAALFAAVQFHARWNGGTPKPNELVKAALQLAVMAEQIRSREQVADLRRILPRRSRTAWPSLSSAGDLDDIDELEPVEITHDAAADAIMTAFRAALSPRGADRAWEVLKRRAGGESDGKIAATLRTEADDGTTVTAKQSVQSIAERATKAICRRLAPEIEAAIERWRAAPTHAAAAELEALIAARI